MTDLIYKIDFAINDFIYEHLTTPALTPIMKAVSFLGNAGWFWIVLAIALLIFKKTRKIGVTVAISLILSLIFTNLTLKPLIARPRPWVYAAEHLGRDIVPLIPLPHDASFPSGHTSVSFAGAMPIFMYNKKYGTAALILAALIGYSRLYFFVHYPSDVIGGAVLGILYGIAAYFIVKYARELIKKEI